MKGVTQESVIEGISIFLSDERVMMISDLKAALQRELLKTRVDRFCSFLNPNAADLIFL